MHRNAINPIADSKRSVTLSSAEYTVRATQNKARLTATNIRTLGVAFVAVDANTSSTGYPSQAKKYMTNAMSLLAGSEAPSSAALRRNTPTQRPRKIQPGLTSVR